MAEPRASSCHISPEIEHETDRIPINQDLLRALYKGHRKPIADLLSSSKDRGQDNGEHKGQDNGGVVVQISDTSTRSQDQGSLWGFTRGGNSTLHFIASNGDLDSAERIYGRKPSLLLAANKMEETPLHWAARSGQKDMVSKLISFAQRESKVETLLRKMNQYGETALHEAARYKHYKVVKVLMETDRDLAERVDTAGVSPLFLAIIVESVETVRALIEPFPDGPPSKRCYVGPENRTALHAAVLVNPIITEVLLSWWQNDLATEVDNENNTALHYAASASDSSTAMKLLDKDSSQSYVRDTNGSYPVHVAARMGHVSVIKAILNRCPDSDELLDGGGRNCLHVAVNYGRWKIVTFICESPVRASKMVNVRDNEGNTPLHLAAKNKDQRIVAQLLRTRGLCQDIMNKECKTPRDVANVNSDLGIRYGLNREAIVDWCFTLSKAASSPCRLDHSLDDSNTRKEFEEGLNKYKSLTKSMSIVSVLIATVTFAATFTMPGGYRSDDSRYAGSVILAKRYSFRIFLISDTAAFLLSVLATFFLTCSGSSNVDVVHRKRYLHMSLFLLLFAAESMVIAFTSGVYMVIFPGISRVGFLACLATLIGLLLVVDSATWQAIYHMAFVRAHQYHLKWNKYVKREFYLHLVRTIIAVLTRDYTGTMLFGMVITGTFIFSLAII